MEHAFGVLHARFAIIHDHARLWSKEKFGMIIRDCIIFHNMIVEDERYTYTVNFDPLSSYDDVPNGLPQPEVGEEILLHMRNTS